MKSIHGKRTYAHKRKMPFGADTKYSCMAAENTNTDMAATFFGAPIFSSGKKKCRTSQLCTGRFQCLKKANNNTQFVRYTTLNPKARRREDDKTPTAVPPVDVKAGSVPPRLVK